MENDSLLICLSVSTLQVTVLYQSFSNLHIIFVWSLARHCTFFQNNKSTVKVTKKYRKLKKNLSLTWDNLWGLFNHCTAQVVARHTLCQIHVSQVSHSVFKRFCLVLVLTLFCMFVIRHSICFVICLKF